MNLTEKFTTYTGLPLGEAIKLLDKLMPDGAYTKVTGVAMDLTDIKPSFLYPLIEEAFGPVGAGWWYEAEVLEHWEGKTGTGKTEYNVMVKVTLRYALFLDGSKVVSEPVVMMGGGTNLEPEWAYKGAVTNAVGAAWSMMGAQRSVYQGLRSHKTDKQERAKEEREAKATQTATLPKSDPDDARKRAVGRYFAFATSIQVGSDMAKQFAKTHAQKESFTELSREEIISAGVALKELEENGGLVDMVTQMRKMFDAKEISEGVAGQ